MSNDTTRSRPNVLQYIGYCYGRVLPDSMRDWVRNDLAGKGATRRTMLGSRSRPCWYWPRSG